MTGENKLILPDEVIVNKILLIRGQRVMIDSDLAELYGVPTKRLNEQIKRNIRRFPELFMFELTREEKDEVVANCDHLNKLKHSSFLPNVFTQYGVLQAANILNSDRAILMGNRIIEVFIKMHEMLLTHKDILLKLEQMEGQVVQNSEDIQMIFEALKQLLNAPQEERKPVGYKITGKK